MADVPTIDQFKIDPKKASKEDIEAALELLAKQKLQKEKVKRGIVKGSYAKKMSEMTPEEQKKARARTQRLTAKNSIFLQKAKKAGITVTEAEIDAYLKR